MTDTHRTIHRHFSLLCMYVGKCNEIRKEKRRELKTGNAGAGNLRTMSLCTEFGIEKYFQSDSDTVFGD